MFIKHFSNRKNVYKIIMQLYKLEDLKFHLFDIIRDTHHY